MNFRGQNRCLTCCISMLLLLVLSAESRAGLIFTSYSGATVDGLVGYTVGTEFTVGATALQVNRLGVYDELLDGLIVSKPVGIWRTSDSVLLGSAVVPSGTAGVLIEQWRFVDLTTPFTLAANNQYRIAALSNITLDVSPYGGTFSLGSGITSVTGGTVYNSNAFNFSFPYQADGTTNRVFANADVSAVPELGSMVLLLVGGIGAMMRYGRVGRRKPTGRSGVVPALTV